MEDLSRRQVVAFGALLLLVVALAYGNTLKSPFTLDDSTVISQSDEKFFDPFPPKYRHLFFLSFAINKKLGQLDPFGYHVFNISLHFLTSLIIFFIVHITLQRGTEWERKVATPISVTTTLFFALSPVHTETVSYISGRTSGLAGLFYFSSFLFFIIAGLRERTKASRLICYLICILLFIAAFFSKEVSLSLPAIYLLYDFCFMNGDQWCDRKTRFHYFYLPLLACGTIAILNVPVITTMVIKWWGKIDFYHALQQSQS